MTATVLVNFRLDRERPVRVKWLASDGVPGDGYKAQVVAVRLRDGTVFEMDASAIVEQTAPDAAGGIGAYLVTFNGMVGFATDHTDRARAERIEDEEIEYDLAFVREDGSFAVEDEDYKIVDRPNAMAHKLSHRDSSAKL